MIRTYVVCHGVGRAARMALLGHDVAQQTVAKYMVRTRTFSDLAKWPSGDGPGLVLLTRG